MVTTEHPVRQVPAEGLRLGRRRRPPLIEFLCRPEDRGVIAEPVPARTVLPAWFRSLPATDAERIGVNSSGLTVKRCMPFLDALSLGWVIPLAATVRLEVKEGAATVDAGWDFDRTMVSNHAAFQVAGNPREPRPPMKLHNHWTVRTAPGWSCLFVPPLNRPADVVEVFSGVVDTDLYASPVNFPFVAVAGDGIYTLPRGMPLVQVIPFRRSDADLEGLVRAETPVEAAERTRIHRSTRAGNGWYRANARAAR